MKNNIIYYFCIERFYVYVLVLIDVFCFMFKCKMIWKEFYFCFLYIIEDESEINLYIW